MVDHLTKHRTPYSYYYPSEACFFSKFLCCYSRKLDCGSARRFIDFTQRRRDAEVSALQSLHRDGVPSVRVFLCSLSSMRLIILVPPLTDDSRGGKRLLVTKEKSMPPRWGCWTWGMADPGFASLTLGYDRLPVPG